LYWLIVASFLLSTLQAQSIDVSAQIGYNSIKAQDLKSHLSILASDSLEGRETSYPGQKKAAIYIADFFKKLKLEEIGDSGTYFQHFDVEVTRINPESKIITDINGNRKEYKWEKDFIAEEGKDTTVTGPVAFVGFTDTELDSISQAKLKGRIVFVFIGKKNYADDTSMVATIRRLRAIRHDAGAIATLMIPDKLGPATFIKAVQIARILGSEKGSMKLKDSATQEDYPHIRFIVSLQLVEELLKLSDKSLEQIRESALHDIQFIPTFIDDSIIRIDSKIIRETRQTENVVGLLQGSDSLLKSQTVAITAHYDHLGKTKDGVIYPGADDDGSGTATVLELAEAFVNNPVRPKRSMLFMTVSGEEKGLLGSQFYVNHPIIPLNRIITDLNIDMIGRIDTVHEVREDTNYIYVIGSDKISPELDSILQTSNKESVNLDLDYLYNNEYSPEQLYRRSDHYNFAKNGIPVVFFFDGFHADFHRPTDTVDKILFNRMTKISHLIYDLGWRLANSGRPLTQKQIMQ
jgi:hypothetical protein